MEKRIRVLVLPVLGAAYETFIEPDKSLEGLQKIVGGLIELVRLPDGVDLWCNEEGRLIPLPPNRMVGTEILRGNLVLARHDEEGNTIGLNDDDVEIYRDTFPMMVPINAPEE